MPDLLPLDGLRVLEFGDGLAAPLIGLALADLGADVVRCEDDSKELGDCALQAALSRGKRVYRYGERDRESLLAFAAGADVALDIRRVPDDVTRSLNSDVVRLALPPFSSSDPDRANHPDDEGLVLAAAGVFAEQGPNNRLRRSIPTGMPMPIASAYAAAYGTVAILAAVYGRIRHGHGETIEVPLFNALLEGFSYNHLNIAGLPERYTHPPAKTRLPSNARLPEVELQALLDPLYRSYQTADGHWFYVATPAHRGHVKRLLQTLGLWKALVADGLPLDDSYLRSALWRDPERGSVFAYPKLAPAWCERLRSEVGTAIARRSCAEWEAVFAAEGLCGTRVRSSAEWSASAHAQEAGLIISVRDPLSGMVAVPGPFVWQCTASKRHPRRIVEDAQWLGAPWRYPKKQTRHLPLAGVRVLDLCNVIAGPTVAGTLVRFGADVTKIDPPSVSFDPFITMVLSLQSARGKESLLLDIKDPAGRLAFDQLAAHCDLITFNGTDNQLSDLGLSLPRLSALKRNVVLTQVSAFDGPQRGPFSGRLGVDEVLQAATGVMHRMRAPGAPPEEYAHFGTIDVVTGVWGASGAIAGLIGAVRDGKARRMATSLAAGGASVQFPFLWRSDKHGDAPDPSAAQRPHPQQAGRLLIPTEANGGTMAPANYEVRGVTEPLRTYAQLRASLAHPPAPHNQPLPDTLPLARFESHRDHPSGLTIELVSQCAVCFEHTALLTPGHPRKYGADTRCILQRAGCDETTITALLNSGAAAESWPFHEQYLPD